MRPRTFTLSSIVVLVVSVALSGAASHSPQSAEPVNFRDLQAVLPELPGWTKGKPVGEKMTSPVSYSEASVDYTKGNSRIQAKLTDSAFNQMLMMGFNMMGMMGGYDKQTEDGYEKSVKVGENPGMETRNDKNKSGELTVIVNKRFILALTGSQLDDNKALYQLAQAVDLKKLSTLK